MTRVLRNLAKLDASGRRVLGTPWRGYLGSQIPVGSAIYGDLALPADNDKDYSLRITAWPTSGVLFLKEDGSPIFTPAADGTFTATATEVENGIDLTPQKTLTFQSGAVGTIITTPGNSAAAGVSATILQGFTISALIGNSAAAGVPASVLQGLTIVAGVGNSTAAGVPATVNGSVNLVVSTTPGNNTADGVPATITGSTVIYSAAKILQHAPENRIWSPQ